MQRRGFRQFKMVINSNNSAISSPSFKEDLEKTLPGSPSRPLSLAPIAKKVPFKHRYHGREFDDPYRNLFI
jgi:hypothetical protein